MDFFKELFHSFVPHAENDYRPYFFRAGSVLAVALVIAVLFASASYVGRVVLTQENLAAVIAAVLVDLTNGDRAGNQLGTLKTNPVLVAAAQLKANDMAAKGYFAHNSPDNTTPWDWFKKAGYKFSYAGENLAVYFSDSIDVERAWMNSPGHRANILNGKFTEIGIATAQGVYQGYPTTFVVQMFGTPAKAVAPVVAATTTAPAPAAKPATTTQVAVVPARASVEGVSTSTTEEGYEVLTLDNMFIAVKNLEPELAAAGAAEVRPPLWQKIIASPKTSLGYVYTILGFLVFLAMTILIAIEINQQRPKNILFAAALILLMAGLLYLVELALPAAVVL